jgi:hypothetical protein
MTAEITVMAAPMMELILFCLFLMLYPAFLCRLQASDIDFRKAGWVGPEVDVGSLKTGWKNRMAFRI